MNELNDRNPRPEGREAQENARSAESSTERAGFEDSDAAPSRWSDREPVNADANSEQAGQVAEAWKGINGLQRDRWADASQNE